MTLDVEKNELGQEWLKERIAGGENQTTEFKRIIPPKELGPAICAFTNTSQGGDLFIGVEDDGIITGVDRNNELKSQYQNVARNATPSIRIEIKEIEIKEKVVFWIHVFPQEKWPCSVRGEFYIREGANCQKVSYKKILETYHRQDHLRWNQLRYSSYLATANLLGSWNENNEEDKEIIKELSGKSYEEWIPTIQEIKEQEQFASPLECTGGKWKINRVLSWDLSKNFLSNDSLDKYKECAIDVLSERDPQFDLSAEARLVASIYGKNLRYSEALRGGLAETLALLGNRTGDLSRCDSRKPEDTALLTLRGIFDDADWILWASLDRMLPALAEASPGEFLDVVEEALQRTPCPFGELFSQETAGISGRFYISGLLRALETLAWEKQFFVRACVVLGRLAFRDPGGSWFNRPANSLFEILLPWLRHTTASFDKRKVAVRALQKEVPEVAWGLLLDLLPDEHKTSMGTRKPRWRDVIPLDWKETVTKKEWREQVSFYAESVVSMADGDVKKLSELIRHLGKFPHPYLNKLLERLSSEDIVNRPEDERLVLWENLKKVVSKHRHFHTASWALDDDVVSRIEDTAELLAPRKPSNIYRRLFCDLDVVRYEPEGKGSFEKQTHLFQLRQQRAVKEILDYEGVEGVVEFAGSVVFPSQVGHALGMVASKETDAYMLPGRLEEKDSKLSEFVNGYVRGRQCQSGWEWADKLDKSRWSHGQVSQFLGYLPFEKEAWNRAVSWLGEHEKEYWRRTSANPYEADGNIEDAIDKLIDCERPFAAVACLRRIVSDGKPLNTVQCIKALLAAVSSREEARQNTFSDDVVNLIKALQDSPDTDLDALVSVEWKYLSFFYEDIKVFPKTLENKLASDPEFFCEVIRALDRSRTEAEAGKESGQLSEREKGNLGTLLHKWRTLPGTQSDGKFSGEKLRRWLEEVKKICTQSGHLEAALKHVGQVLFHCPPGANGLWIDPAAAGVLNDEDAEEMRDGFCQRAYNSRGVQLVDPDGKPERELAEKYRSKADKVENAGYYRFAIVLRKLARRYDFEAEWCRRFTPDLSREDKES